MIDCARLSFSSMLTSMKASAFFSSTTSASSVWLMRSSRGVGVVLRRTSTLHERIAVARRAAPSAARDGLQVLHDPIEDEVEQLVHRPVFDQLARQQVRAS